jgi:hypothetical protein
MTPLDEWTSRVCASLGLDPSALDRDLVLDLARDVAHGVARPAAPLTAYLLGLAAGQSGGDLDEVTRLAGQVRALIPAAPTGGDPDD